MNEPKTMEERIEAVTSGIFAAIIALRREAPARNGLSDIRRAVSAILKAETSSREIVREEIAKAFAAVTPEPKPGPKPCADHRDEEVLGIEKAAAIFDSAPEREPEKVRPRIVCLCGSTRFYEAFQEANYRETMAGRIVLSVGFYPHSSATAGHGEGVGHDGPEKIALDELHKRKIDLADEVLVLNVGGYIGSSTASEIAYAAAIGKPCRYLEPHGRPMTVLCMSADGGSDADRLVSVNVIAPDRETAIRRALEFVARERMRGTTRDWRDALPELERELSVVAVIEGHPEEVAP